MRVMPLVASPRVRRFAALALTATTLITVTGCRDWIVRTRSAESISLAPTNFEVPVNASVRVVGTAFDKDGNTIGTKTIRFSSSNTTVATITADGLVIGVSPGSAIIAGEADGARGETTVTVIPEIPNNILVTPSPVTLRRNNIRQFTATPRTSAGTAINGLTINWQTSNSALASVSPSGQVTALAPGNVVISASVGQVFGSAQVTITEVPIGSISLAPTSRSLQVTEEFIPTVTLRDTANNVMDAFGRTLNWSSSNALNATVNASGVVRGVRVGPATISAASPDNPAINGSMNVTVINREVKSIVITPRSGFLRLAVPRQLSATLRDSADAVITGRVVTWTSLTPTIASISTNGNVTGLSLGTAQLTARVDDAADTVTFAVTRIPVGEVTLSPTNTSVIQGQTVTLNITVKDTAGTEVTDRAVVWGTSNPTIASVNNGLVTGIATGNVTITATSENRSGNASVTVLQVPVDSVALVNPADAIFSINAATPGNTRQVQLELLDAGGSTVLNRNLLITSSSPSVANATWNQQTRILTVSATPGTTGGSTTITFRALTQGGNPEGKTSRIEVTVNASP